jgi:hypothetical protein
MSSQSAFTSHDLVTDLNNGYSSAMFSLDVSQQWILTMEILQLLWSRCCLLVSTAYLDSLKCQPTTSLCFASLHPTQLTADNWLQLDWCPRYITSGWTQQKTPPPTILPFAVMGGYLARDWISFLRERVYWAIIKQPMFLLTITA